MRSILLFDLGETLVRYYNRDEFPALLWDGIQSVRAELERFGHRIPSDSTIRQRIGQENYEAKNGRVRPLYRRLARIFKVPDCVSKTEWLPFCRTFLKPIFSTAKLYDDTLPAIDNLKANGFRIGILSNCPWGAPSEPWIDELRRHGLLMRCEVAIFCADVGWRKPALPIFRRALNSFGCKPKDCLFIGDNPRWDIYGARRAKIAPILIDRKKHTDLSSVPVIRTLFDVMPLLERLKRTQTRDV